MKRFLVALTALIASLAIGLATVSTTAGASGGDHVAQLAKKKKKKKKKKTFVATISLTVTVTPANGPYSSGSGTFSGSISSGGPAACRAGRSVTIARNGTPVATTATNGAGSYSVTVNSAPAAGQYTASTPRVVFKKKGKKNKKTGKRKKKKIICTAATSGPVTVS